MLIPLMGEERPLTQIMEKIRIFYRSGRSSVFPNGAGKLAQ